MTDGQEMTPAPVRINVWRALKALLLTLVIPLSAAVIIDLSTGLLPFVTIIGVVVFIPLAAVVVGRILLAELDRVIAIVAPEPVDEAPETTAPAEVSCEAVDSTALI